MLWIRTLLLVAVLSSVQCTAETADENGPLKWRTVSNEDALCNDFTRAGFFHRNATDRGAGKWIVYLESGAVCYSNETCNRRYFQSHIRDKYSRDTLQNARYGDFDTSEAYAAVRHMDGVDFVNPLMTSMKCFEESQYFPNGLELEGKDFFDRSTNHVFADHGQVVVPYCSSDVWLGSDSSKARCFPQKKGDPDAPCECFDRGCFEYNPTASGLQFTFRGKTIFQSVLRDLDRIYDLRNARELILVGSSAGGVGALNLAKSVTEEYPNLDVRVVLDSAWFVNFRDGINAQFNDLQNTAPIGSDPGDGDGASRDIPHSVTLSSSSVKDAATSSDYIRSSSLFQRLSSTFKAGSITSSIAASSHVITSSVAAPDHVITLSAATSSHVIMSSVTGPDHVIPSSATAPALTIRSSETDSTTQLTPLASSTSHSTPTEIFAAPSSNIVTPTPGPTLDITSSSDGSGSGEIFSGMHTNVKRSADMEEEEDGATNNRQVGGDLLSLLRTHDACFDIRRGYPCCLSAQCVLTASNQTTDEPYFPRDVKLFVVTSLYDAFILSQALQDIEFYQSDSDSNPIGLAVEYISLVGEYGGVMDNSISEVRDITGIDISVYLPQCFQHIYFATSTLWGEGRVFGTDPIVIEEVVGTFR